MPTATCTPGHTVPMSGGQLLPLGFYALSLVPVGRDTQPVYLPPVRDFAVAFFSSGFVQVFSATVSEAYSDPGCLIADDTAQPGPDWVYVVPEITTSSSVQTAIPTTELHRCFSNGHYAVEYRAVSVSEAARVLSRRCQQAIQDFRASNLDTNVYELYALPVDAKPLSQFGDLRTCMGRRHDLGFFDAATRRAITEHSIALDMFSALARRAITGSRAETSLTRIANARRSTLRQTIQALPYEPGCLARNEALFLLQTCTFDRDYRQQFYVDLRKSRSVLGKRMAEAVHEIESGTSYSDLASAVDAACEDLPELASRVTKAKRALAYVCHSTRELSPPILIGGLSADDLVCVYHNLRVNAPAHSFDSQQERLFDRINELTWASSFSGLTVSQAYCDHWHRNGLLQEVQRAGRSSVAVCPGCFEDDDVVVYPEDEPDVPYLRSSLFWSYNHDAWFTYDRDQADADEYDEDNERECRRALSWSTNVMDFLPGPDFTPSPTTPLLMGLELEMEVPPRMHRDTFIEQMLDDEGLEGYCVFKLDGSLSEARGIEMVTRPARMSEHISMLGPVVFPEGTRAWDAGDCGMHVHIDSRCFGMLDFGKFLLFMNSAANASFIRRIAGRHPSRDEQAERYAGLIDSAYMRNVVAVKKGGSTTRYRLVNVTTLSRRESERLGVTFSGRDSKSNASTVEVRVFRASLKRDRLFAQLEFLDALIYWCKHGASADPTQLTSEQFLTWLKPRTKGWPRLAKWLGLVKPRPNTPAVHETAEV